MVRGQHLGAAQAVQGGEDSLSEQDTPRARRAHQLFSSRRTRPALSVTFFAPTKRTFRSLPPKLEFFLLSPFLPPKLEFFLLSPFGA